MPRRSRSDTRKDLARLLRGVDLYRDWRIAMWQRAHGPDAQFDPNEFVETGDQTLAQFDAYDGPHYLQFLKDVQGWYSVTGGDLTYLLNKGDDAVKADVTTFLSTFEETTGFSFWSEAGLLKKTAAKVLKRGHIAGEGEWYLLKDLLDDTGDTIVPPADHARLTQLSHEFEATR